MKRLLIIGLFVVLAVIAACATMPVYHMEVPRAVVVYEIPVKSADGKSVLRFTADNEIFDDNVLIYQHYSKAPFTLWIGQYWKYHDGALYIGLLHHDYFKEHTNYHRCQMETMFADNYIPWQSSAWRMDWYEVKFDGNKMIIGDLSLEIMDGAH